MFTRREFINGVAMGAASLGAAVRASTGKEIQRPNFVYVLADDLGYGDVSCLNPESKISTEHIDRLAREGSIFTDAHSGSAVCTPTRYGILTGRYSWRSTLTSGVLNGYSPPLIDANRTTVATLLKAQGYHTACIGKWHLGLAWQAKENGVAGPENIDYDKTIDGGPTALGFDYFFGIPASLDMTPYVYIENNRVVEAATGHIDKRENPGFFRGGPIAPGFKHEDVLRTFTSKAVEYIDNRAISDAKKPFFLYLPLSAPHTPILPRPEFVGKSKAGVYGDFVCEVDSTIGQIVDALERNGLADDTLIIVTSDNGCSPAANFEKLSEMGHDPSFHFRGHKADIFEGGHRIPFIARWPEQIRPGSICANTICLTDLLATVAEILGEKLPDDAGEDSVSMLSALRNAVSPQSREATVHQSMDGSLAIRQGQWKLEFCAGSGGWSDPKPAEAIKQGLPRTQLYDLSTDVGERHNVHDEHPEIVVRLTELLESYLTQGRSTPGTPQKNDVEITIWGPRRLNAGA
jgi:arylsulfatase A